MKRLLPCLFFILLLTGLPISTWGQVLEHQTHTDQATFQLDGRHTPSAVDTTGIRYHLKQQNRQAARQDYERLRARYPDWQPPADLLRQLAAPSSGAKTGQSRSGPPSGEAERLQGWRLLSQGLPQRALDAFDRALASGGATDASLEDARYGRLRALIVLDRLDAAAREAVSFGLSAKVAAELHGRYVARALALAASHLDAALESARQAAAWGEPPWATLGWKLLGAGHHEAAITAFKQATTAGGQPRGGGLYGLVLAYSRSERLAQATDLACANLHLDSRLSSACADLLSRQAVAASKTGEWLGVLAATTQLKDLALASRASEALRGWALYHTGQVVAARDLFGGLHKEAPSKETAQALMLAAERAGDRRLQIAAWAATEDDPLWIVLDQRTSDIARERHLYIAAQTLAPGRHEILEAVERPYIQADLQQRQKRGEPGEERIDATTLSLHGGLVWDGHAFAGGLDATDIHTGGTGVVRDGDTLLEPWAAWSREGVPLSFAARLGTTPFGGAVSATPVGSFDIRYDKSDATWRVGVFSESRRDSLLALSGQEDGNTGRRFGRVIETGIDSRLTWLPYERVDITAGILGSRLAGWRVEENQRQRLSLASSYDLQPENFAYFRVGPHVTWQRYEKNLSHFTLGHGGYYSPQRYLGTGLQLDALTTEGQHWLVGLRARASWRSAREEAIERYPLGAPAVGLGGDYAASSTRGVAADLLLRGGIRLSESWMLTGWVAGAIAPEYREASARIGLKYTFGRRAGVLSSDLQPLSGQR